MEIKITNAGRDEESIRVKKDSLQQKIEALGKERITLVSKTSSKWFAPLILTTCRLVMKHQHKGFKHGSFRKCGR